MIRVGGLSRSFRRRARRCDGVAFECRWTDASRGLLGPSGAGKSTTLTHSLHGAASRQRRRASIARDASSATRRDAPAHRRAAAWREHLPAPHGAREHRLLRPRCTDSRARRSINASSRSSPSSTWAATRTGARRVIPRASASRSRSRDARARSRRTAARRTDERARRDGDARSARSSCGCAPPGTASCSRATSCRRSPRFATTS